MDLVDGWQRPRTEGLSDHHRAFGMFQEKSVEEDGGLLGVPAERLRQVATTGFLNLEVAYNGHGGRATAPCGARGPSGYMSLLIERRVIHEAPIRAILTQTAFRPLSRLPGHGMTVPAQQPIFRAQARPRRA